MGRFFHSSYEISRLCRQIPLEVFVEPLANVSSITAMFTSSLMPKRAAVEVGRSDYGPQAVDDHYLGVDHGGLVLEYPSPGLQQVAIEAAAGAARQQMIVVLAGPTMLTSTPRFTAFANSARAL